MGEVTLRVLKDRAVFTLAVNGGVLVEGAVQAWLGPGGGEVGDIKSSRHSFPGALRWARS